MNKILKTSICSSIVLAAIISITYAGIYYYFNTKTYTISPESQSGTIILKADERVDTSDKFITLYKEESKCTIEGTEIIVTGLIMAQWNSQSQRMNITLRTSTNNGHWNETAEYGFLGPIDGKGSLRSPTGGFALNSNIKYWGNVFHVELKLSPFELADNGKRNFTKDDDFKATWNFSIKQQQQ